MCSLITINGVNHFGLSGDCLTLGSGQPVQGQRVATDISKGNAHVSGFFSPELCSGITASFVLLSIGVYNSCVQQEHRVLFQGSTQRNNW